MREAAIHVTPTLYDVSITVVSVILGYVIIHIVSKLYVKLFKLFLQSLNRRRRVKRYFLFVSDPVEKITAGRDGIRTLLYPPLMYMCEATIPAIYADNVGSLIPVSVIKEEVVLSNRVDSFLTACKQLTGEVPDKVFCYYAGKKEEEAIKLKDAFQIEYGEFSRQNAQRPKST